MQSQCRMYCGHFVLFVALTWGLLGCLDPIRSVCGRGGLILRGRPVQVLVPGAYRSVCIELELHHLAVNSVVQVGRRAADNAEMTQHRSRLPTTCTVLVPLNMKRHQRQLVLSPPCHLLHVS